MNAPAQTSALGLYVHVPFCAKRCEYCAFYERDPRRGDIDRYLEGVKKELDSIKFDRKVDTVFWGGGTPGLLLPRDMEKLAKTTLVACHGEPSEWTVEMTPQTARADRLEVLHATGVTRISIGVQSFDEQILHALGRTHTEKTVMDAVENVRKCGFERLNLDMMFALPGQSFDEWERDLKRAIALKPDHISTYCLSFEDDTPLLLRLKKGKVSKRTADEEADYYLGTWHILEDEGYEHYEVSNFALPGRECIHNVNTWRMQEWAGAGPSAASQINMRRYANVASLEEWLKGVESGSPALKDVVDLDAEILATDCIIFGLRMVRGVNFTELETRFPSHDFSREKSTAQTLFSEGLAKFDGERLHLTERGMLLADEVALEFME
jgi:oxygen-independent coproporphyrinogen III oxidase